MDRLRLIKKRLHLSTSIKNLGDVIYDYTAVSDITFLLDEISSLKSKIAEFEDAKEQERLWITPCGFGDTIYHICKCKDISYKLDGTWSGPDGGPGTATGYYCPYEDNCPHDTDDCDLYRDTPAVFEDAITGFYIGEDSECIYLENTPSIDFSDINKTAFLTRESAESALKAKSTGGD